MIHLPMKIAATSGKLGWLFLMTTLLMLSSLWVQGQPARISEIIRQALRQAPRILQAQEDVALAELELVLLRRSSFAPQLNISAIPFNISYRGSEAQNTGSATFTMGLSLPTGTTLRLSYNGSLYYSDGSLRSSLSAELTQNLLMDFKLTDTALALQHKQDALSEARQSLLDVQREATLDGINQLLNLLLAQEALKIAQARVALSQKRLDDIRNTVESGQAGRSDLLAAQVELRQSELILARQVRSLAINQEKFLDAFALENIQLLGAPHIVPEMPVLAKRLLEKEITQAVIAQDSRVRRASTEVVAAERDLRKIAQDALPRLGLAMNYEHKVGWGIGFSLSHNLLTGPALKMKEAERSLAAAQRALESVRQAVKLDVLSQRNTLHEAYGQLEVLTLKRELLALQQEMKQKQLESGFLSTGDWNEFLIQRMEFESEHRAALYQLAVAYLRYRNSLGMGFSLEEVIADE